MCQEKDQLGPRSASSTVPPKLCRVARRDAPRGVVQAQYTDDVVEAHAKGSSEAGCCDEPYFASCLVGCRSCSGIKWGRYGGEWDWQRERERERGDVDGAT